MANGCVASGTVAATSAAVGLVNVTNAVSDASTRGASPLLNRAPQHT